MPVVDRMVDLISPRNDQEGILLSTIDEMEVSNRMSVRVDRNIEGGRVVRLRRAEYDGWKIVQGRAAAVAVGAGLPENMRVKIVEIATTTNELPIGFLIRALDGIRSSAEFHVPFSDASFILDNLGKDSVACRSRRDRGGSYLETSILNLQVEPPAFVETKFTALVIHMEDPDDSADGTDADGEEADGADPEEGEGAAPPPRSSSDVAPPSRYQRAWDMESMGIHTRASSLLFADRNGGDWREITLLLGGNAEPESTFWNTTIFGRRAASVTLEVTAVGDPKVCDPDATATSTWNSEVDLIQEPKLLRIFSNKLKDVQVEEDGPYLIEVVAPGRVIITTQTGSVCRMGFSERARALQGTTYVTILDENETREYLKGEMPRCAPSSYRVPRAPRAFAGGPPISLLNTPATNLMGFDTPMAALHLSPSPGAGSSSSSSSEAGSAASYGRGPGAGGLGTGRRFSVPPPRSNAEIFACGQLFGSDVEPLLSGTYALDKGATSWSTVCSLLNSGGTTFTDQYGSAKHLLGKLVNVVQPTLIDPRLVDPTRPCYSGKCGLYDLLRSHVPQRELHRLLRDTRRAIRAVGPTRGATMSLTSFIAQQMCFAVAPNRLPQPDLVDELFHRAQPPPEWKGHALEYLVLLLSGSIWVGGSSSLLRKLGLGGCLVALDRLQMPWARRERLKTELLAGAGLGDEAAQMTPVWCEMLSFACRDLARLPRFDVHKMFSHGSLEMWTLYDVDPEHWLFWTFLTSTELGLRDRISRNGWKDEAARWWATAYDCRFILASPSLLSAGPFVTASDMAYDDDDDESNMSEEEMAYMIESDSEDEEESPHQRLEMAYMIDSDSDDEEEPPHQQQEMAYMIDSDSDDEEEPPHQQQEMAHATAEAGTAHTDAAETGSAETGAVETGTARTDAGETGSAETDAGETGAADAGSETDSSEAGSAETGSTQTSSSIETGAAAGPVVSPAGDDSDDDFVLVGAAPKADDDDDVVLVGATVKEEEPRPKRKRQQVQPRMTGHDAMEEDDDDEVTITKEVLIVLDDDEEREQRGKRPRQRRALN